MPVRDTRFVFVEGIVGAGKTTTAWWLADQLRRNGIAARFLPEGPTREEPNHPLRVATSLPHPFQVWRDVTVDEYVALSLEKWRAFVREAERDAAITVCDGLLFHGNMTDLLLMDTAPPVLRRYVEQVVDCLRGLRSALIYFRHADVAQAIRRVCEARGSRWQAYQVDWKVTSPYAARRSLGGFEGLVELYRDYRAICDDLFEQLAIPKLAILNEGDWAAYRDQILTFLRLAPAPPEGRPTPGATPAP
jgi:hypothetical protein